MSLVQTSWLIFLEIERSDAPIQLLGQVALGPQRFQLLHSRNILNLDMLHSRRILESSFPPVILVHQDAADRRLLLLRRLQKQIILGHVCLWPADVVAHLV